MIQQVGIGNGCDSPQQANKHEKRQLPRQVNGGNNQIRPHWLGRETEEWADQVVGIGSQGEQVKISREMVGWPLDGTPRKFLARWARQTRSTETVQMQQLMRRRYRDGIFLPLALPVQSPHTCR